MQKKINPAQWPGKTNGDRHRVLPNTLPVPYSPRRYFSSSKGPVIQHPPKPKAVAAKSMFFIAALALSSTIYPHELSNVYIAAVSKKN